MAQALMVDATLDINLVHDGVQRLFPDVKVYYEAEDGNHNFWLEGHEGIVQTEHENIVTREVSDAVNLIFNKDFISFADKELEALIDDAFIVTKFDLSGLNIGSFSIELPATLDEVVNAVFVLLRAK